MGNRRVLIGAGVAGVAAAAAALATYLLLKDDDDDEGSVSSVKPVTIHVKIRSEFCGLVIGRGGETIREIQRRTGTRIHFRDELETATHRVVCVTGNSRDAAQLAEILIHQTVADRPKLETLVLTVPGRCIGYIIGQGGETIRSIQNASKCKIDVERTNGNFPRKVTLKGTAEQIGLAKAMIDDRVVAAGDRKPSLLYSASEHDPEPAAEPVSMENHYQTIWVEKSRDPTEVYVSSVTDPWNFHVQKVGPESVRLDKLSQDMAGYYSLQVNRQMSLLDRVKVDDVAAAQFTADKSWYRCKILEIFKDEYEEDKVKARVEFVDFGFSEMKGKWELFQLKPEFLRLKFQAVKCSLANVKPSSPDGLWSEKSVDEFEKLTHVFQWKVMLAKMKGFRSVPQIELIDAASDEDVEVAEKLISMGLAQPV